MGGDRIRMAALGGTGHKAAGLNGPKAVLFHDPATLMFTNPDLSFVELRTNATDAIASLMRLKNLHHFLF
jgi:hypothetical protein